MPRVQSAISNCMKSSKFVVQSYHFKLIIHAASFQGIIKANNSTWPVNLYNYRDQYHILCTKKSVHLKLKISLYILHPKGEKKKKKKKNYLAHSLMKKLQCPCKTIPTCGDTR